MTVFDPCSTTTRLWKCRLREETNYNTINCVAVLLLIIFECHLWSTRPGKNMCVNKLLAVCRTWTGALHHSSWALAISHSGPSHQAAGERRCKLVAPNQAVAQARKEALPPR